MTRDLLARTFDLSATYLESLEARPVRESATLEELRSRLDVVLPEEGQPPTAIIESLARDVEPGLVASAGPRFFGFVVGGSLPVAVAADWLTSTWDQNAQACLLSPAAAVVEEVVGRWLLDLLGLPRTASFGLVTGAQMATFVGLAAARHEVLRRVGWEVELDGLIGAPAVDVVVGEAAHGTVFGALRMLGFGERRVQRVAVDDQGRLLVPELARTLEACGPSTIVCAQAGNVNTGASDALAEVADRTQRRGAWLHVDGAFGLWAAASPTLRGQITGYERADSWAVDAHKWLNVPHDSGIAVVAHPAAHGAAFAGQCAYAGPAVATQRDGMRWVPENSRRARAFGIYAALRALGRQGVTALVEGCCAHARHMAERLAVDPDARILNDVCLNQVLVRFSAKGAADADALNTAVAERVRAEGYCWLGTTTWRGATAIRVSISNWSTTSADIDRSADAILAAARHVRSL
jgi:glutamate/tyrosine decarboxylase-like PLP-dependent enzyme